MINNKKMLVDVNKATASLLRSEVLQRDPTLDPRLLTRRNCVSWLCAHGIHEIPTHTFERDISGLFTASFDVQPTTRDYTFVENYAEIQGNSADPVMVPSNYNYLNYAGAHDISYDYLKINTNLQANSLILNDENIIDLLSETMADIRTMNQTLVMMRSNVDLFYTELLQVQSNANISTGNLFSPEFSLNVQSSNVHGEYSIQSYVANVHMRARLSNTDQQGFSVRLPYPVHSKPFMRASLHTRNGLWSTLARVHTIHDQVHIYSHLFREAIHFPIEFRLDGTYVTHTYTDATWITPMKFDALRDVNINVNDVTVSEPEHVQFERGTMEWNRIDQSTKTNINMTIRILHSWVPPIIDVSVRLPDTGEILGTEIQKISGYGSVLLLPDSRFTVRNPIVYIDTMTRTLRMRIEILNVQNVKSLLISAHTVHYTSELIE